MMENVHNLQLGKDDQSVEALFARRGSFSGHGLKLRQQNGVL